MARKSYWQSCVSNTPGAKDAIKSWFLPLSEGMTPYRADILCDLETDAEKKLRALMTNESGQRFELTRSRSGRNTTISMKRIESGEPPIRGRNYGTGVTR